MHSSLVELTTLNRNKSGIVVYLSAKEVEGLNCGFFLKVPWMQETWEVICSLRLCNLIRSWLIELTLYYQHCESLQSQKLILEGTFVADALLKILYTQQQLQKLLSRVDSEEWGVRPRTAEHSVKEGMIEVDGERLGLIESVGMGYEDWDTVYNFLMGLRKFTYILPWDK